MPTVSGRVAAALLATLVVAEFLGVALLYSTQRLFQFQATAWQVLLSRAFMVPHLMVAMATGAMIFGAPHVSAAYHAARKLPLGLRWPFLLLHAVAFGVFLFTTDRVLGNRGRVDTSGSVPFWLIAGIFTVVTPLPAAIGWHKLFVVTKRTWPLLATGAAVGIVAWVLGRSSEERLWAPLRRGTLLGAHHLLRLVRADAFVDVDAFVLGTRAFSVIVDPVCSGYEGIGLAAILIVGFLIVQRRHLLFPQALILIPIGVSVIWLGNIVRVAALVLVGGVSRDVAVGGFHSHAGSLLFCALTLGVVAMARRWRFVTLETLQPDPSSETDLASVNGRAEAYLAPLLSVLLVSLITGALLGGAMDWFYPLRLVASGLTLWRYRTEYRAVLRERSWFGVAVGAFVFGLWMLLVDQQPGRSAALAVQLHTVAPAIAYAWIVARAVGAIVMVPVVEELAFRGFLLRRLHAADFMATPYPRRFGLPLLASSALFGLMHGEVLAGAVAGLSYGLTVSRRGHLGDAVISHATTNLLLVIWGTATGHWALWM